MKPQYYQASRKPTSTVKEGIQTIVEFLVGHDLPAVAFNSIEFAKATDDFDGAIATCVIQASQVVEAGYLPGSRNTMVDSYWDKLLNNHPKLNKMDIQVSSHPIKDFTNVPWDPMNNVPAAHILCSIGNEEGINKQMSNMYNKPRKQSCTANDLPKGCTIRYVPLNQMNTIAPTTQRKAQLIKSKIY